MATFVGANASRTSGSLKILFKIVHIRHLSNSFLDRIYKINRIKRLLLTIDTVFVLVLKRCRGEVNQQTVVYSRRIETIGFVSFLSIHCTPL